MVRSFALAALFFVACSSEVDDKPAAEVTPVAAPAPVVPVQAEPAPPPPAGPGQTLAATGSIRFVAAKVTRDHQGEFGNFEGQATLQDGQIAALRFVVNVDSVTTDTSKLTEHLKSPDFFDVATHPTATFESTSITPGGENGATHTVSGTLDLHGQRHAITFPATITVTESGATARAEFTIDRTTWGIVYPGKPDDLIQNNVLLKVDLTFAPKAG